MSIEKKIFFALIGLAILAVLLVLYRLLPKRLRADKFGQRWHHLQDGLKDKATWSEALLKADTMLDEALKKRKFKGGSMGERMVSAQRYFTNNDDLWYAHNLCKKLRTNSKLKLKEDDVKDALIGFRQALRDVGALKGEQQQ